MEGLLQVQIADSSCEAEKTLRALQLICEFYAVLSLSPLCQLLYSVSLVFTASLMAPFWGLVWQSYIRLHILWVTHIPELKTHNFTRSQNM